MRLLTHNMLCNIKGVSNGYPLKLEAEKWVVKDAELNADFLHDIFSKIEWPALVTAVRALGCQDLSAEPPDSAMLGSGEFLYKFHHALHELHVEEGARALVCSKTACRFPINKSITNMLLHKDEV